MTTLRATYAPDDAVMRDSAPAVRHAVLLTDADTGAPHSVLVTYSRALPAWPYLEPNPDAEEDEQ